MKYSDTGIEIENVELQRVGIPTEAMSDALIKLGFERCVGVMEIYKETYVDVVKMTETIDKVKEDWIKNESDAMTEALYDTDSITRGKEDGTVCFYEIA